MVAKGNIKKVAFFLVLLINISFINVNAQNTNQREVILGGTPFGLKLFTNGVIVIEVSEENSPAKTVGIKTNDLIIKANNKNIVSNEELKNIIETSDGKPIRLTIKRNNKELCKTLFPVKDENNNYVAGMWIRDSTAGIGTVTYFDESTKTFGALGHGICDKDTGLLMPLRNGKITQATISSYQKGSDGVIGGLNGYFEDKTVGEITKNNGYGVYGCYTYTENNRKAIVANDNEIKTGDAKILSTIDENGVREYEVKITKLNLSQTNGQNMLIEVTDEELLNKTGGIIQGMSGSPILQNGKLVGAVTHVFINSPEKGYGIAISNMMSN